MERLTTNKDVSEMSMVELAHNCCYVKGGAAWYRDYDTDIDARELTIELLKRVDIPNEFTCDEDFDNFMFDASQYGIGKMLGLIALFYQHLWAIADLRERLKKYEDAEEQGLLLKLPCKVGDTVWLVGNKFVGDYEVRRFVITETGIDCVWVAKNIEGSDYWNNFSCDDIGKTVFYTREEAEEALKKTEERR